MLLVAIVLPFLLVILLLRWMLQSGLVRYVVDQPNHRSLHTVPVPRTGGLAIMGATFISWCLSGQYLSTLLLAGALVLTILSLVDDICDLSAGGRFLGHFVVAVLFVRLALPFIPVWGALIIALAIVWMTNLFNFMDGSDGLAGGMAVFGFGTYAVAAWVVGNHQLFWICIVIVASSAAFLRYNFHPASIFMGDAGSIPLGFLVAAIGLLGWLASAWPVWFPVLVFSPFIVDATVTLLKRILRGEKAWEAHRSHYYQQLVQMGWGHRKTAWFAYGLMLATGGSAIWLQGQSMQMQWAGVGGWLIIYGLLLTMFERVRKNIRC